MNLVLLAAGTGSRLGNKTKLIPKALIEVNNKKLIEYSLTLFKGQNFIKNIIVVTGFCGEDVYNHINKLNINNLIRVHNPNYLKGNLYSLLCAKDHFGDGFIILNVDHIYPKKFLNYFEKTPLEISALCDFDRPLSDDDMKVKLNSLRQIDSISKKLSNFDGGYIGCTIVPENKVATYLSAVDKTLVEYGENAVVENVLQTIVRNESNVHILDTSGMKWLEVDTPEDLAFANQKLMASPSFIYTL